MLLRGVGFSPFQDVLVFGIGKSIFVSDTWLDIRVIGQAITWLERTASFTWQTLPVQVADQLIYTVMWRRPNHVDTLVLSLTLGKTLMSPTIHFRLKNSLFLFLSLN